MIGGLRADDEQARRKYDMSRSGIQIKGFLGRGCEASVCKVRWFQENFAAKVFPSLGSDRSFFEQEVAAMTKMRSHPRIVRLLGLALSWPDADSKGIVMELMVCDLWQHIRQRREERGDRSSAGDGPMFPLAVAVDIMVQVAEGVDELHNRQTLLYHRDLKPNNILVEPVEMPALREEGYVRAKLADFSATEGRSNTFTLLPVGTTRFRAPEINRRSWSESSEGPLVYPAKADAYSFAMTCYAILSGEQPFLEIRMQHLRELVATGERSELPAGLPSRLTSLLQRCWHKEPTKRPSFAAICRELRYLKFLLTIGGEEQFRALDGPDEDAKVTAEIVKRLRWIEQHELHFVRHIGSGGYGSVDECVWQGDQRVAVKNLFRVGKDGVGKEAALLVREEHRNVVKLVGCAFDPKEDRGMIVMELMEQNLQQLISQLRVRSPNAPPFALCVALDIMLQVASAMKHSRDCNVLHRDLKTSNILVTVARGGSESSSSGMQSSWVGSASEGACYEVKLADFGLSKYKSKGSMFTTRASEAQFWRAPETLEAGKYSWPADVFSFGVVCYEILSGEVPFSGMQGPELLELVRAGRRPEIPRYCPAMVAELVNACWATNPDDRPGFAEVCTKLEACLNVKRSSPEPGMA